VKGPTLSIPTLWDTMAEPQIKEVTRSISAPLNCFLCSAGFVSIEVSPFRSSWHPSVRSSVRISLPFYIFIIAYLLLNCKSFLYIFLSKIFIEVIGSSYFPAIKAQLLLLYIQYDMNFPAKMFWFSVCISTVYCILFDIIQGFSLPFFIFIPWGAPVGSRITAVFAF